MIIYTASDKSYADSVINYIDPFNTFFPYRLYRHNCVKIVTDEGQTLYVKDLRIIKNVPLENMIIIDNSVLSFAFHLENGIPILPYYSNKDDTEMDTLKNYLQKLAKFDDLTVSNGATFNLKYLMEEAVREQNEDNEEESTLDETKVSVTSSSKTIPKLENEAKAAAGKDKKDNSKETKDKDKKVKIVKGEKSEKLKKSDGDKLRQPTRRKSKIQNLIYENMEKVKK